MLSNLKRRERKRASLFTSAVCMLASCSRWCNWEYPADVAWLCHGCKSVVTKSTGCSLDGPLAAGLFSAFSLTNWNFILPSYYYVKPMP